jgi:DNA repair exonuclease SbcCD nuclease subunit
MTLAHFSDTHLGYRQHPLLTEGGINQREFDVMKSFGETLKAIESANPDLVIHAGDFFHQVRPSNWTIVHSYKRVVEFQATRNHRPFIIIGGNHDTPQTSDTLHLLDLFKDIKGIHIATALAQTLTFDDLDLEVLAIPDQSFKASENVDRRPSQGAKYKLLTMHASSNEVLKDRGQFNLEDTNPGAWTYVALGDYHVASELAPNVRYSGSTDFTSTNPWEELSTPKQWLLIDLDSGKVKSNTIPTRAVIDLPQIDCADLTVDQVHDQLASQANWNTDRPLVRQVLTNVLPELRSQLSQEKLQLLRNRTLHYTLDLRSRVASGASQQNGRFGQSLEEAWKAHVPSVQLILGMDQQSVIETGLGLLEEVRESEATPLEA